jgi:Holliday junction DNA helicase RuvA
MIATLNGKVAEKLAELVVIDVNGVGYGLLVNAEDYGRLAVGEQAKLYVYEYIRDNAHDLFGFTTKPTMALFEQLLSVNGVGPRMALNMLSIGSADEVRGAIASGDTKFIQSASGVGKKVAERVVVDLKDKVGLADTTNPQILFSNSSAASKDDAVQALVTLGYSVPDSVNALANVDSKLKTEDRIKQALREIKV